MAVTFDEKLLLLTPPKTGSQWIHEALNAVSCPTQIVGNDHVNGHGDLSFFGSEHPYIACFVRRPEDWLESYWSYREQKKSWDSRWAIDRLCGEPAGGKFNNFFELYEKNCRGYVSNMFRNYTHMGHAKIDFVGRQENLCTDFLSLLSTVEVPADKEKIVGLKPVNVGSKKVMSTEQRQRVQELEAWSYQEYNYN